MRKIFIMTFTFLLVLIQHVLSQENDIRLYKFQKTTANGRFYGLINANGDVVAEPIFDEIGFFSEGLAYVKVREEKDVKAGYIDTSGKIVIEAKYQPSNDKSRDFYEGLASVRIDGEFGYINRKGELIIASQYAKTHPFNEGYAVVEPIFGERIIIDQSANVILDPVSVYKKNAYQISKGETVNLDERVNSGTITMYVHRYNHPTRSTLVNMNGNFLFSLKPSIIHEMSEGLIRAQSNSNGSTGYLNKKGKTVIPFDYLSGTDFNNGHAKVKDKNTKMYGIIDLNGNYVVPPEYTYISDDYYKSDYIFARKPNSNFGYIDYKGNQVIDFKYAYGGLFSEGLAVVSTPLNKNMYIDKNGKKAFELEFNISQYDNENFKGGIAKVNLNDGHSAYINKKGEVIFKFK
ncbi:WG repeat-containing protein [Meridianimaribacter flavus]|uniref:WG repeat protein n=1 Tax=Meridianimaribacter flavus TaxID=571115 RepID=A0ABY2G1B0_9FLAO|nr:WG repeat-containing protein [Meridianimaribacter flavus]TDY05776.1 WG repeat protein [Meridianimaribacter flavus]